MDVVGRTQCARITPGPVACQSVNKHWYPSTMHLSVQTRDSTFVPTMVHEGDLQDIWEVDYCQRILLCFGKKKNRQVYVQYSVRHKRPSQNSEPQISFLYCF